MHDDSVSAVAPSPAPQGVNCFRAPRAPLVDQRPIWHRLSVDFGLHGSNGQAELRSCEQEVLRVLSPARSPAHEGSERPGGDTRRQLR